MKINISRKRALQIGTVLLIAIGAPLSMANSCGNHSSGATKQEQKQQNAISKTLVQNQPLPQFNYSQLRQNLIEVETAEAQGVQTTTFFFNQGSRDPIQTCPSIGAPISTTMQLSNPLQLASIGGDHGGTGAIQNLEPTGVYTGDSTGTYVMCIGSDGKPYANYWEGFVQAVFAPAVWDDATHQVKITGPATFKFTKSK